MDATVDPPHRADDFRMAGMPDQDDFTTLVRVTLTFDMHLRNQWACGVDNREPTVGGAFLYSARHTVRAENRDATRGNFVDIVDEMGALSAQPLDDMAIVDD